MLELDGVTKTYPAAARAEVAALRGVDLTVPDGELIAIIGPSGSGTSTLMNILGCLDVPSAGHYRLDGVDVATLSKRRFTKLRGSKIGFVFQSFALIPNVSVLRNVEIPLIYRGARERRTRARRALGRVGLAQRVDDMPVELFDAQRQKVLIARALIHEPSILLIDEPTPGLDPPAAAEVLECLAELNAAGLTVVLSTHEDEVTRIAHRVVRLEDGRVVGDRVTRLRSI